jgi:hypothetical protein
MSWRDPSWKEAAQDYARPIEKAQQDQHSRNSYVTVENIEQSGDASVEPFPFVFPRDITLVPKAFLIEGFVGASETSAWYGPPDGGKSTVALDAGCHVAAGLDYGGRRVMQGGVLYIAVERGAVVQRRVLAWCRHHDLENIPLAVVAEMIDLRTGGLDADRIITTADAFAEACGQPVVWIIVDTLNRALAGGDETQARTWARLSWQSTVSSGRPMHTAR